MTFADVAPLMTWQPREYASHLRVIPSFRDRCVAEWRATLVPPRRAAAAAGAAAEHAAREAALQELKAFMDAAEEMMTTTTRAQQ